MSSKAAEKNMTYSSLWSLKHTLTMLNMMMSVTCFMSPCKNWKQMVSHVCFHTNHLTISWKYLFLFRRKGRNIWLCYCWCWIWRLPLHSKGNSWPGCTLHRKSDALTWPSGWNEEWGLQRKKHSCYWSKFLCGRHCTAGKLIQLSRKFISATFNLSPGYQIWCDRNSYLIQYRANWIPCTSCSWAPSTEAFLQGKHCSLWRWQLC